MSTKKYTVGDLIEVEGKWYDDSAVLPIDPLGVVLKYQPPSGTTTTWTYPTGGFIERQSVGVYTAFIDTTGTVPGIWTYQWQGIGPVGQSIKGTTFVTTAALIP